MREPLQVRSRKSLDRVVAAADSLLLEKDWSDLSVAELTRKANVSVGSFYARFGDKEALLDYLDDRYTQDILEHSKKVAAKICAASDLASAANICIASIVNFYANRVKLSRALIMRARAGDSGAALRTHKMTASLPEFIGAFEAHKREIKHEDWRQAATEGFSVVFHAIREQLLFPQSLAIALPKKRLQVLLARIFVLHLTTLEPEA